jgi:hypothetical protein
MRFTMLTVIILLTVSSALRAADRGSAAEASDTMILTPQTASRAADMHDSARPAVFSNRRVPSLGELEGEPVCYHIRSYLMAKDDADSDSTSFAGYSTCQMSSRFGIRHARPAKQSEKPQAPEP